MRDEEVRQQVDRTDAFIVTFRELIASAAVDPTSPCEFAPHRGLERIGATVGAVNYVHQRQLGDLNAIMVPAGFLPLRRQRTIPSQRSISLIPR